MIIVYLAIYFTMIYLFGYVDHYFSEYNEPLSTSQINSQPVENTVHPFITHLNGHHTQWNPVIVAIVLFKYNFQRLGYIKAK